MKGDLHVDSAARFSTKFSDLIAAVSSLAKQAEKCNAKQASFRLDFLEDEESVGDGEWVPSICVEVRRSDNLGER